MTKHNHVQKAQKKVEKAVSVFDKAINDVESAQATLLEGIKQDAHKINALEDKILSIKAEIAEVWNGKNEKGRIMETNKAVLDNLKQFKVS